MTNATTPFDPAAIESIAIDPADVDRTVAAIMPATGEMAAADLALAIACTDLTTLQGDDTEARVEALCARARADHVAAVCVYPALVPTAAAALRSSGVAVATVAAGFPHGLSPLGTRIAEIEAAVAAGADEVDIVIRRGHALTGNWRALYDEVAAFRAACGPVHMKAILATGELPDATTIARAAHVAIAAGADFLKTSTGKEAVNATLEAGVVLMRAAHGWHARTGVRIGVKAAGGIGTAEQALRWLALLRAELGDAWMIPSLFRFGASRLLDDIAGRPHP